MRSYFMPFIFAFTFYYIFRYFFDKSLPIIPILRDYRNSDDIIDGIFTYVILMVGALIGFFILKYIDKIF
ncbi:hypothetical protein [Wukongibacter sp. M2B1]|uniref:hypothetical protein n=1 Tax=Wukongibacter sp. M2B1 TaxID=3088895 RepID=UPI003D79EBF4